tara:strand:- start:168 stop:404 length:237 start_codon:yes stop_codon:yes gene_type:complete
MPEHIDLNTDLTTLSIDSVVYTPVRLYNAFAVDDTISGLLEVEKSKFSLSPLAEVMLPKRDWVGLVEAVNLDGLGIEA